MFYQIFYRYLLSLLIMFCFGSLQGKEIHAFILADTLSDLRESTLIDVKNIKKIVRSISRATGLPSTTSLLTSRGLTVMKLWAAIHEKQIGPEDIVLFYYTGHGFRSDETKSSWPHMYLTRKGEEVDIEDIVQVLLSKKAYMYLILADCCNNYLTVKSPIPTCTPKAKKASRSRKQTTYHTLFSGQNVIIIASGSIPGTVSWATEKGGVFTNAFIESIEAEFFEQEPQWKRIFKRTSARCKKFQKPQFHISSLQTPQHELLLDEPVNPVEAEPSIPITATIDSDD